MNLARNVALDKLILQKEFSVCCPNTIYCEFIAAFISVSTFFAQRTRGSMSSVTYIDLIVCRVFVLFGDHKSLTRRDHLMGIND